MKIKLSILLLMMIACTGKRQENYEVTEEDKRIEEKAVRIVDEAVVNMESTPKSNSNNTLNNSDSRTTLNTIEEKQISKFVVSSLYHKKPSIVKVTLEGDIYHASYINSEGDRKSTKIQFIGNIIRWGNSDGRWREHPLDEELSYEIEGKKVLVKIRYSDGSESTDEYQL